MATLAFVLQLVASGLVAAQEKGETPEDVQAELVKMQASIDRAIDRGAENILARQLRDGSWGDRAKPFRNGQTSLSAYMLIKAGIDRQHPAILLALDFLGKQLPNETYSAGCQLLFYESMHDPSLLPRMQEILDLLLSWQVQGAFSYPLTHAGEGWADRPGIPDLSNMQYAALGILAARRAGLEVPPKAVKTLIQRTLEYQERLSAKEEREAKRYGKERMLGFCYRSKRGYGGEGKPTGSMTAAGASILHICLDALGDRAGDKFKIEVENEIRAAVNWLGANFSVERNPGNNGWLYYYLYGLERVGDLLGIDRMGGHYWYRDGAKFIVSKQQDRGQWGDEADTCFAVLFLKRATSSAQTGGESRPRDVWTANNRNSPLWIRASGHSELALWVLGFNEETLKAHETHGLRVARVEWYVGDTKIAEVAGSIDRVFDHEPLGAKYRFTRPDVYKIKATAFVVDPEAPKGCDGPLVELTSKTIEVPVRQVMAGWMKDELDARDRNVLVGIPLIATASSFNKAHPAEGALDGRQATRWVCDAKDEKPTLTVRLSRFVDADRFVFEQSAASSFEKGMFDDIRKLRLTLNERDAFEVTMADDTLEPTVFDLPRKFKVKRIDVEVVERTPGWAWPGQAGLTELRCERTKR